MLRAAHAAGVPVPEVLWLGDDPKILDGRFFVMERIEGETLARRLLREPSYAEARRVMTGQLGAMLARIHAVPLETTTLAGLRGSRRRRAPRGRSSSRATSNSIGRSHPSRIRSSSTVSVGSRRRLPPSRRRVLVHGDYRIGNVMFGPEGLRVVLDWEQAHVGDPMEDLGWMCVRAWRFGSPLPVGGIGERDEFFRAYERAGGDAVDPEVVRFWEALGDLKWAVICIAQAKTFLDGGVKSVELASIGRRTAEAEYDLLELVD